MVSYLKYHFEFILFLSVTVASIYTKAPIVFLDEGLENGVQVAVLLFVWAVLALRIGLHESKQMVLDYSHNKDRAVKLFAYASTALYIAVGISAIFLFFIA